MSIIYDQSHRVLRDRGEPSAAVDPIVQLRVAEDMQQLVGVLFRPPWHEKIGHQDLNGLAALVECRCTHLDQTLVWPRFQRTDFENFAFEMQLVAGAHRRRPTELVEPGAEDAARRSELAFDQQPHRQRCSMPAARGETAED